MTRIAIRLLLVCGVAALLALPLVSCDGDGVGLDKNGDLLVEDDKPIVTQDSVATLLASKDNTLYENPLGNTSNGSGQYFFAGQTATAVDRRALIAFDLAGIPAGATITAVTLTLEMSRRHPAGVAENFTLHRVTENWGEGPSDAVAEEGSGTAAATGDATWLHTFFDTALWTTEGGSFSATVSGSQSVDATGGYTWSDAQMAADAQSWLDSPTTNFGWMLRGNEGSPASAKRFNSRENATSPPTLLIEFTR